MHNHLAGLCALFIDVSDSMPQACTLARRNAEVFLKYIHRNNVSMPGAASHTRGPEQQVKGQLCAIVTLVFPLCSCVMGALDNLLTAVNRS